MAKRYSLKSQIAEVEREIAMRRKVYPSRVAARVMSQGEADLQLGLMESVLETLRWTERNQDQIKALFPPKA